MLAAELPTASEMINGYLKLLEIIRLHDAKAVITTITPFNGFKETVLPEAELVRQEVNQWMRNQTDYDNVFDLDEIVKDPYDSSWLAPQFRGDDNLHFVSEGGIEIANKFDLEILLDLVL